jgi:hypothetical protein
MTKRLVIYFSIVAALGALWLFVIHGPLVQRQKEVSEQTVRAEAQLADYLHTMEQLPQYLQTSRTLETLRSELNSSLYAKNDILKLLGRITDDAVAHDLAVIEISPPVMELIQLNRLSEISTEPQYLNLTIDIRGQYVDFGRFVSYLEQEPFFRSINHCSIRGGQETQQQLDFSIGFQALLGASREAG